VYGASSPSTAHLPRVSLAQLPTPVEELPRLSERLAGPTLLVKRDDQTGLATGGNKARKLEFLVADALAQGADTLVTQGSSQSNHCRQTAAAAARLGLSCVLLLRGNEPSGPSEANLLLNRLLGARLRFGGVSLDEAGKDLRREGRRPYLIPTGGSSPTGVAGYVAATEELFQQLEETGRLVDTIVVATGSGGTQAGIALGARQRGFSGRILGISVSRSAPAARGAISDLANGTADRLGLSGGFQPGDFEVDDSFLGEGYGIMSGLEARAIRTVAESEGLLLDPVYTGRAFGGLMQLIEQADVGRSENVLFWHTGGTPALFRSDYATLLA
jgi:D-cysteine desulfhydrase family pyridoxal phosphate-dependent enzyme